MGESLLGSDDFDAMRLAKHAKNHRLIYLFQLAQSKANDTDFCGSTGRGESVVSKLEMMNSVVIPEESSAANGDE